MVEPRDLTNAIALNSAMFNTATAVGPAAAGVTYALFGPGWCFTINAVTFLPVIVALRLMSLPAFVPKPGRNQALADLKEGLKYVAHHPLIRTVVGMVAIMTLFGISYITLIPAWAVNVLHGDAKTNGFLIAARGIGALAGALLIASLGRFHFQGKLLTAGSVVMPVLVFMFALVRWTPLSLLLLFGAGVAQIFVYNLCNALVQTASPDGLRGRVMSVYALVFFGSFPIAALGIGTTAEHLGSPAAVLIGASIAFLAAILVRLVFPGLWSHASPTDPQPISTRS
jgi:predicted MFS family arabinose efflux permease